MRNHRRIRLRVISGRRKSLRQSANSGKQINTNKHSNRCPSARFYPGQKYRVMRTGRVDKLLQFILKALLSIPRIGELCTRQNSKTGGNRIRSCSTARQHTTMSLTVLLCATILTNMLSDQPYPMQRALELKKRRRE